MLSNFGMKKSRKSSRNDYGPRELMKDTTGLVTVLAMTSVVKDVAKKL